ncbi:MAG: glycoside hydrolase family 5 protein [Candidatus Omnitrophica bacterium]|nr:glycoside hydrolase family 5 protein [Candidatus Omnitrophota bacterium]
MNKGFLKQKKTFIVDGQGNPVHLKGVNFGGWLMMEAYFVHAPNLPQQIFEKEFAKACGQKALEELMRAFRDNFITESDFKQVALWGMNCVRLPFHYKVALDKEAVSYLDKAIAWAKKYKIYLILDLHAAWGAQNSDWHSDSLNGRAELWIKKSHRQKTYRLWEALADRYKDETIIAGYDILNEAVLEDAGLLNEFYRHAIKAIRRSDKNHILFIEGKHWAQQIDVLDDFNDDNWVYSIHFYEPNEFVFNLIPLLRYPFDGFDKDTLRRRMEVYAKLASKKERPVHMGEFGVNYRSGCFNEHEYLRDELKVFNDLGFHWTYWTYKAVKSHMFPDGIYSYYPNSPWVHRQGPKTGWHCWAECWDSHKDQMVKSWRTSSFQINTHVLKEIQKAL